MSAIVERMCDGMIRKFGFEHHATVNFFRLVEDGANEGLLWWIYQAAMKYNFDED